MVGKLQVFCVRLSVSFCSQSRKWAVDMRFKITKTFHLSETILLWWFQTSLFLLCDSLVFASTELSIWFSVRSQLIRSSTLTLNRESHRSSQTRCFPMSFLFGFSSQRTRLWIPFGLDTASIASGTRGGCIAVVFPPAIGGNDVPWFMEDAQWTKIITSQSKEYIDAEKAKMTIDYIDAEEAKVLFVLQPKNARRSRTRIMLKSFDSDLPWSEDNNGHGTAGISSNTNIVVFCVFDGDVHDHLSVWCMTSSKSKSGSYSRLSAVVNGPQTLRRVLGLPSWTEREDVTSKTAIALTIQAKMTIVLRPVR